MATGQSETLKQFKELAEAVLRVTERLERLLEGQERLVGRADACAERFDQLASRADGLQRSREGELDEAYRRHREQVDELAEKVRWASRSWTWKPLMWGAFGCVVGGLVAGAVGAGMLIWVVLNPDSPLSGLLSRP